MTLYHYLGADKPLLLGSFGENYTLKKMRDIPKPKNKHDLRNVLDLSDLENEWVKVYETEIDFAFITVSELRDSALAKDLPINKRYMYELDGSFQLTGEDYFQNRIQYQCNEKCFRELFAYLKEHLQVGETIEVYSCWDSEEKQPRDKRQDGQIDVRKFKITYPFCFEDKQLITFFTT
ncbi:hypothetical protein NST02_20550 [Robertmurraya sp. FSL W8-0741]|uniref:hypothetical protein n=1 Tax=Robertmurraya sp. FSL W8-0741 TaxID=2954629 RepID=UPI0030F762AE